MGSLSYIPLTLLRSQDADPLQVRLPFRVLVLKIGLLGLALCVQSITIRSQTITGTCPLETDTVGAAAEHARPGEAPRGLCIAHRAQQR